MNISTFRHFAPFRCDSGRVILSPPDAWREVELLHRAVEEYDARGCVELFEPRNVLVQPDPFAEYGHIIVDPDGWQLWVTDNHREYVSQVSDGWSRKKEPLSFDAILKDNILALSDRCPLLTWWIPTRHPERVRERWPTELVDDIEPETGDIMGYKDVPSRVTNVRLGLHESDAASTVMQYWHRQWNRDDWLASLAELCGGVFILREDGDVEVLE